MAIFSWFISYTQIEKNSSAKYSWWTLSIPCPIHSLPKQSQFLGARGTHFGWYLQDIAIFPGGEHLKAGSSCCAWMHLCLCVWLCCSPKQEDKGGIILSLPATGFSDLSLKHLVLASVRHGILTLVSKRVWQFPYFQALDRSKLFSSRGRLIFLANTDSQMLLSHSVFLLAWNFRLKVRG